MGKRRFANASCDGKLQLADDCKSISASIGLRSIFIWRRWICASQLLRTGLLRSGAISSTKSHSNTIANTTATARANLGLAYRCRASIQQWLSRSAIRLQQRFIRLYSRIGKSFHRKDRQYGCHHVQQPTVVARPGTHGLERARDDEYRDSSRHIPWAHYLE